MMDVAVLFARHDSIYKSLPGCDVWDIERDARTWPGGTPIVAHPPCRSWGTFRHVAKPVDGERELALWAVDQIRRYGGVLEHPARSALWREKPLPEPGQRDDWGGGPLLYPNGGGVIEQRKRPVFTSSDASLRSCLRYRFV